MDQPTSDEPRSDSALITAFCEARDDAARQAAFSGLVRQHGAMVLGACRRITGNPTDAEDAAQAVFLTLASKAKSLRGHPTVGGWLHRVARNIALRQRESARVRARYEANEEAQAMTSPPDGLDDRLRGELREVLDSALDNLSERYRAPLVLHYLEGHSQEEVARILHLNPGTLASLLSRGRDLLRNQLSRKGVAVGTLALTAVLTSEASACVLPVAFASATTKAASAVMAGSLTAVGASGAAAPHVIALSKGALTSMAIVKLSGAAAIAAVTLTVGAFTATTLVGGAAETKPIIVAAAPVAPSDPQNLDQTGPEVAVMSAVRALRTNDAVAFLRRLTPTLQSETEQGWKNLAVLGNPWISGMLNGGLSSVTAADAVPQLTTAIGPLLAQIPAQELAQHVLEFSVGAAEVGAPSANRGPRGGLPSFLLQNLVAGTMQGLISGMLASGLEGQQTLAVQALLADVAAWLPTAGLDDQAKAGKAAESLVNAARALGITSTSDLAGLSLPEALDRMGKALPQIKQLLAVYGLEFDRVLESVKVGEVKPVDGKPDQRLLIVTFTAFGKPHALPLKMLLKDSTWTVANDSPLAAWLRPRLPGIGLFGGGFGGGRGNWGGQGGGPGGQPGGDRGQRGQRGPRQDGQPGQDAQPAPAPNPGF